MATNPLSGAKFFLAGIPIIFKPNIKKFVVIPLIINFVLFSLGIYLLATQYENLIAWLTPDLPSWVPDFINDIFDWFIGLLWVLFAAIALMIIFFGFTVLANIVAAPFNAYLSSAVEHELTGKHPIDPRTGFFKIAVETIGGEIKKLSYFFVWLIPVLIISVVPVVNVISPFVWALFSAWMLSLQYIDYPLANRGYSFAKIRYEGSQHKLLTLGFGGTATMATMIPILNFLVMPVSVAGATILTVKSMGDGNSAADQENKNVQDPLISR